MRGDLRHAVFATPLGPAALAWSDRGLVAMTLPAADADAALAELRRFAPRSTAAETEGFAAAAAAGVAALLSGERPDLLDVPLDLAVGSDFERRVWDAARRIPPGTTTTYGALAAVVGERGAARAVGVALGRNPVPPVVPCHRIVAAGGRTGGFSAPGGVDTKMRLLAIEAAEPAGGPDLFGHFGVAAAPAVRRSR